MLDGTGRDPPNPTYTCGENDTKRAIYNMEECIEKGGSELLNKEDLEEILMN